MYSIGQVSEIYDIPVSTLRYYDKEGLFPHLKRSGPLAVSMTRSLSCSGSSSA